MSVNFLLPRTTCYLIIDLHFATSSNVEICKYVNCLHVSVTYFTCFVSRCKRNDNRVIT